MKRLLIAGAALLLGWPSAGQSSTQACRGTVYLTFDTSNMKAADLVAQTLREHQVKATFFLANEKTYRGDWTLDPAWAPYWKSLVADGHAFGSHTWQHGVLKQDAPDGHTRYVLKDGTSEWLDGPALCNELDRVGTRFKTLTGRALDPLWRAPGGYTTPLALKNAAACGYRHVGWTPAGFLGDELPSDKYPNAALLKRALHDIHNGDILMMHLGIYSRKDPLAPILGDLLVGLKDKGLCFATYPAAKPTQ